VYTKSLSGENVEHSNKGVLITATEEITVFGVNKEPFSTDGFVSYPTDSLGTEYILVTYKFNLLSFKMTFNLLLIFHLNSWISTFVICVY
jgi:hypothetical protein